MNTNVTAKNHVDGPMRMDVLTVYRDNQYRWSAMIEISGLIAFNGLYATFRRKARVRLRTGLKRGQATHNRSVRNGKQNRLPNG